MKHTLVPISLALMLLPLRLAAQELPPGRIDAPFFAGQAMRALDEKVSILVEAGKVDAAIEELRRVFTFQVPREHPIYELKAHLIGRLADLLASKGAKDEALETLKALLADVPPGTPAEATAWLDAGAAYRALGMTEEALKAFDRAIELSTKLAQGGWRPPRGPRGPIGREGPPPKPPAPQGDAPPPRSP